MAGLNVMNISAIFFISHGIIITFMFLALNLHLDFELTETVCKLKYDRISDNQRLISLYSHTPYIYIFTHDFCGNIKTWLIISFSTT